MVAGEMTIPPQYRLLPSRRTAWNGRFAMVVSSPPTIRSPRLKGVAAAEQAATQARSVTKRNMVLINYRAVQGAFIPEKCTIIVISFLAPDRISLRRCVDAEIGFFLGLSLSF